MATAMNRLADDIIATHDSRIAFIGNMKRHTSGMLCQFHNNHGKTSKDLKGFVTNVCDSTGRFLRDFRKTHEQMAKRQRNLLSTNRNQRSIDVGNKLKAFRNERQKVAKVLRNDLKSFTKGLSNTVKMLSNTVKSMRKEMSDDLSGASKAWKKVSVITTKRQGVMMPRTSLKADVEVPRSSFFEKPKVSPKVEVPTKVEVPKVEVGIEEDRPVFERFRESVFEKRSKKK